MNLYSVCYLSEQPDYVLRTTGLALDELEEIVGRFGKTSMREGKLRGELREYADGRLEIYNNFNRKGRPRGVVWSNE